MSTSLVETRETNVVALDDWRTNRTQAVSVLQNSLYPGARPESVGMVLDYCAAARLDPFQKPVHITQMSVKIGQNDWGDDQYENRDVIMPGIGLYRVQAARTGEYAGMDEPVFGPTKTLTYKKKVTEWVKDQNGKNKKRESWVEAQLEYPEWVKVTVYRLVGGVRCPFPAVEFWIENYATAGRYTDAPNAMWARRPRGQLVKCAEAQALRKAFPEVGAQPTHEEMEGRVIELDDVRTIGNSVAEATDDLMPQAKTAEPTDEPQDVTEGAIVETPAASEKPAGKPITDGMLKVLRKKASANKVDEAEICRHFGASRLEELTIDVINKAMTIAGGAS